MTETTRNRRTRLSALALIVANLVPLIGVLVWDWSLGELLVVYWAESAVIGVINVLKMLMVGGWAAVPFCLFFCVHFGGFMVGHALFIGAFFLADSGGIPSLLEFVAIQVFILFISHFVSFLIHWVFGAEAAKPAGVRRSLAIARQMFVPYRRIIVMHITILIGGVVSQLLGSPRWALLLFVLLKLGADLWAHVREHRGVKRWPEGVLPHTSAR
ncbi:MAG: DUF6498-containing protein [Planctomycetota bacterium]